MRVPGQWSALGLFAGSAQGLLLYEGVAALIGEIAGARALEVRPSKSQVAFRLRRGFAYVWRPDMYVRTRVPAVLSIALPWRLESSRFKEVVHPSANVWMHHLELRDLSDLDDEVRGWLEVAVDAAE